MSDERSTVAPTPPLTSILTPEALVALREAYDADPGALADAPLAKYSALYPPGGPYYQMSVTTFYTHGAPPGEPPTSSLSPQFREAAILALFIAERQTITLAIHVYWALMVGMSVEQICEIMLLVAFYGGIDAYSLALGNAQITLQVLQASAAIGEVTPIQVFTALVAKF
jgi:alkylhydroperoxidase/carboxymuconolactone decarboxylase family protein YurZ